MVHKYLYLFLFYFISLFAMEEAALIGPSLLERAQKICDEESDPIKALNALEQKLASVCNSDDRTFFFEVPGFVEHVKSITKKMQLFIDCFSGYSFTEIINLIDRAFLNRLSVPFRNLIIHKYLRRYNWRFSCHELGNKEENNEPRSKKETDVFCGISRDPLKVKLYLANEKPLVIHTNGMDDAIVEMSHNKAIMALIIFSNPKKDKFTLSWPDFTKNLKAQITIILINLLSSDIEAIETKYEVGSNLPPTGPDSTRGRLLREPHALFSHSDRFLYISLFYHYYIVDVRNKKLINDDDRPAKTPGVAPCFNKDDTILIMLKSQHVRTRPQLPEWKDFGSFRILFPNMFIAVIDVASNTLLKMAALDQAVLYDALRPFQSPAKSHLTFSHDESSIFLWLNNKKTVELKRKDIDIRLYILKSKLDKEQAILADPLFKSHVLPPLLRWAYGDLLAIDKLDQVLARNPHQKIKISNVLEQRIRALLERNAAVRLPNEQVVTSPEDVSLPAEKGDCLTYLAIDGEGIHCHFALSILSLLEKEAKVPISDLFDVITGSSFGSVVALGVAASKDSNTCLYTAQELSEWFASNASAIFNKAHAFKKEPLYDQRPVQKLLRQLFQHTTLSNTKKRVIIPLMQFNKDDSLQRCICDTHLAQRFEAKDIHLSHVALCSIADKKYFPSVVNTYGVSTQASKLYHNNAATIIIDHSELLSAKSSNTKNLLLSIAAQKDTESSLQTHLSLCNHLGLDSGYARIRPGNQHFLGLPDDTRPDIVAQYQDEAQKAYSGWETFVRKLLEHKDQKHPLAVVSDF